MRLLRAMAGSSPQWPGDELLGVHGVVTKAFESGLFFKLHFLGCPEKGGSICPSF